MIVDASITDTRRRSHSQKEYVVVEDRREGDNKEAADKAFLKEQEKPNVDKGACWLKKSGKLHFGYKRHTVTDLNGQILSEETTTANESDIKHLRTPLEKANLPAQTPVYADKGYSSAENKEALKEMKLKNHIMHKATKNHPLSEREQKANVQISKVRYCVERTFGSIHCWFGGGVARYVGLAKTHGQHILEAIAHNLYRAPGIIMSNCVK